jgi:hypothetical protein
VPAGGGLDFVWNTRHYGVRLAATWLRQSGGGLRLRSRDPYADLHPGSDGIVHYGGDLQQGGWYYVNFMYAVDPAHVQPTLVRGRQIDGSNELRFGRGQKPARELRMAGVPFSTVFAPQAATRSRPTARRSAQ